MNKIYQQSIDMLKKIILHDIKNIHVEIILFGSRARGDYNKTSDIDIAFNFKKEQDKKKLTILRDKVEDLNIPYKIDLVDMGKVSQQMQELIYKDGIIWKK